jgi:hypothetical protein
MERVSSISQLECGSTHEDPWIFPISTWTSGGKPAKPIQRKAHRLTSVDKLVADSTCCKLPFQWPSPWSTPVLVGEPMLSSLSPIAGVS